MSTLSCKSIVTVLLIACLMPLHGMAQNGRGRSLKDNLVTFCGVKAGSVFSDLGPITRGPYGLANPIVDFPVAGGIEFGFEAGGILPLSESFGLITDIGFAFERSSLYTTVPGTVSPRGIPIPVEFGETLDLDWWNLTMSARLQWILGKVEIQPGLSVFFPGSISALATEEILSPSGATYDEYATRRTRFRGGVVSTTSLLASLRCAYRIPIGEGFDVVPFVEANIIPYSYASEMDIRSFSTLAGVQLRLASWVFVPKDVAPVMITAPQPPPDALVWGERRFETPMPEITLIRKPYLASAVHVELTGPDVKKGQNSDIIVHVLNCLSFRLANVPSDADATIWDATHFELIHKDSILDASPPTAVIRVRSTAEAGIKHGVVTAYSGGAVAFENSWDSATDTVFVWPLRQLPVTSLAGDTSAINIVSTVTDNFSGETVSIPQSIVVIRSRPTKRSSMVPDLVTADFSEPTFARGGNDLSKAGRGLVAALADHVQDAKVIRLSGPVERCKRVLAELAPTGHVRVTMPTQDTATTGSVKLVIER